MDLITTLTYALPHRLMSSLARSLAYSKHGPTSRWLIDTVTRKFGVDLNEAANADPRSYDSFNAFSHIPGVRRPSPLFVNMFIFKTGPAAKRDSEFGPPGPIILTRDRVRTGPSRGTP